MMEWIWSFLKPVLEFLKTTEGASLTTAVSTVVLTLTTIVYAWLTAILARENKLLRKAGTEPQVMAYLALHPRITGPLLFRLANVGQGPAFGVQFQVTGGLDFESHGVRFPKPEVPLTVIPQGDRYETFIGMSWEMLAEPRLQPFTVEVRYRDLKKREYVEKHVLDIRQFEGISRLGGDPDEELVKAVKDVATELQRWTRQALPIDDRRDT